MKDRYENGLVPQQAKATRAQVALELKQNRKALNLTQEVLAEMAGTKKSNISRMESGKYNPSLDFLVKVAECMGKKLEIHID